MAKGGKRIGAGRKPGSTNKLQICDNFTDKEIQELIKTAKEMSKTDKDMVKYLLDQVYGKARQTVGVDGGLDEDNKPKPIMQLDGSILANLSNPKDHSAK